MHDPHANLPLVVSVAYDRWSLFEAGIASEVFGLAPAPVAAPLYRYRIARAERGALHARGGLRIQVDGDLRLLAEAALVIVPGWRDHGERAPTRLLDALRAAHERGARILSICTGAFVLAAAGLLDGRRATTHWLYADAFTARFPKVQLLPQRLYVDDGGVITSAGSAAGIDACLHVVRQEHGVEIGNQVARRMVAAPHRAGGQAQYVAAPLPSRNGPSIAAVLEWARARIDRPLRVDDLARQALMSERNFLRQFAAQTGTTPKAWLQREQVARAQQLLEGGAPSLETVAADSGYRSLNALRVAFRQVLGTSPSAYRQQFAQPPRETSPSRLR